MDEESEDARFLDYAHETFEADAIDLESPRTDVLAVVGENSGETIKSHVSR